MEEGSLQDAGLLQPTHISVEDMVSELAKLYIPQRRLQSMYIWQITSNYDPSPSILFHLLSSIPSPVSSIYLLSSEYLYKFIRHTVDFGDLCCKLLPDIDQ